MLVFGKLQLGRGMMQNREWPRSAWRIRDVHGMLSEALTYTHTLVAELRPPVLREHGLLGVAVAGRPYERYGMKVTVKLPDEEDLALAGRLHDLVVSTVRELLMNAHKYAGTGLAEVALVHGQGALIHVRDRGKVIDSAAGYFRRSGGRRQLIKVRTVQYQRTHADIRGKFCDRIQCLVRGPRH